MEEKIKQKKPTKTAVPRLISKCLLSFFRRLQTGSLKHYLSAYSRQLELQRCHIPRFPSIPSSQKERVLSFLNPKDVDIRHTQ